MKDATAEMSKAGEKAQGSAKTYEDLFVELGKRVDGLRSALGDANPALSDIDMDASGNALILYADSILDRGAAADIKEAMAKLGGAAVIVYGKKLNYAAALGTIIREANPSIRVIEVEPLDLKEKYKVSDLDVEYPDEARELGLLIRYASAQGLNNGKLIGVIKGKTGSAYKETSEKVLSEHKVPAVEFESEQGIYSFCKALNMLVGMKGSGKWLDILKPLEELSKAIEKAYKEYKLILDEIQTKA